MCADHTYAKMMLRILATSPALEGSPEAEEVARFIKILRVFCEEMEQGRFPTQEVIEELQQLTVLIVSRSENWVHQYQTSELHD